MGSTDHCLRALVQRAVGMLQESDGLALIHRPDIDPERITVLRGRAHYLTRLKELRAITEQRLPAVEQHEVVAALPYRLLRERGFEATDDGTPILAIAPLQRAALSREEIVGTPSTRSDQAEVFGFDQDDDEFSSRVEQVIREDISTGKGSNFVLHRSLHAQLPDAGLDRLLEVFRTLVTLETGAYWTFLIWTPRQVLVGASPEMHLQLDGDLACMNPISGSLRHPDRVPSDEELLRFIDDQKEASELSMVVDEELKIMARISQRDIAVEGPSLKQMANVTHTEYRLRARYDVDPWTALRDTLFCPTVVGSPLQNAARVLSVREPSGRGYYSGAVALIGHDHAGRVQLDSAITIRTAEVGATGDLTLRTGSTVVRESTGIGEADETRAKAHGILQALGLAPRQSGSYRTALQNTAPVPGPQVQEVLQQRNARLSRHWLSNVHVGTGPFADLSALVIDAEDRFTAMLAHLLRSLGFRVTVRGTDEACVDAEFDLVVLGPGPGDPDDRNDPRVARLQEWWSRRLRNGRPTLGVCLSHQVLCGQLGFDVGRRSEPNQGRQVAVSLFGRDRRVGLYNSFVARTPEAWSPQRKVVATLAGPVEVEAHPGSYDVLALRGVGFASVQFHPESILTTNGREIIRGLVDHVLTRPLVRVQAPAPEMPSTALKDGDPLVRRCLERLDASLEATSTLTDRAVVALALTHYGEDASVARVSRKLTTLVGTHGFAGFDDMDGGRPSARRSMAQQLLGGTALLVASHRIDDMAGQAQAVDLLNRCLSFSQDGRLPTDLTRDWRPTGDSGGYQVLIAALHAAAWAQSVGESDVNLSSASRHARVLVECTSPRQADIPLTALARVCIALHHASRLLEDDAFRAEAARLFRHANAGRTALEGPEMIPRTADLALVHTVMTMLSEEHPDLQDLGVRSSERLRVVAPSLPQSATGHAAVVRALGHAAHQAPRVGQHLVM